MARQLRHPHSRRDRPEPLRLRRPSLRRRDATLADKTAFHGFGQALSFADCNRHSRAFAAYLQKRLSTKRRDRIGVMMPNLLAFPIAMMGPSAIRLARTRVSSTEPRPTRLGAMSPVCILMGC
ncbi:AMP-binding protein [Variovorax sp. J31P207]|uniref:AMP-binding protein n=1 Tax=Variovorax sp. J31P207 TaxID=3053510 RepID=UPI003365A877